MQTKLTLVLAACIGLIWTATLAAQDLAPKHS
jgi:hypothetical protein